MASYPLLLTACLLVVAAQDEMSPEEDIMPLEMSPEEDLMPLEVSPEEDLMPLEVSPEEDLMPLDAAYRRALDHYAAGNWTASIRYMELSLRLHRLLRDGVRSCVQRCNRTRFGDQEEPAFGEHGDLRASWLVVMRASCLKRCRAHVSVLSLPRPTRRVMEDFEKRSPYRYLHFAYSKLNNLQRAVPCAHTYLQKNPDDPELKGLMEEYQTQYNLDGYLVDHEQRPYESSFLAAVGLVSAADFSGGVGLLESALQQYLTEHQLCQAVCEDTSQLSSLHDLHDLHLVLPDVYVDALRCRVKCDDDLTPHVGGNFVDNFLAMVYHYLQYAFYKLNDGRSAASCASSYLLFDPADTVMRQNLQFYQKYGQDWGLEPRHFTPRPEAVRHHNQTETLRKMLKSTENFLQMDDKDFLGPEETARTDGEFEGVGAYEESMVAKWWQPNGKGDIGDV